MKSETFEQKKEVFEEIKERIEKYIVLMAQSETGDDKEEMTLNAVVMIAGKCLLDGDYLNQCYS